MFTDQRVWWLLLVLLSAAAWAADPPPDPVKTITPSETIPADDAVPFPVDI
ncbi:MAG: hypothetical protein H6980_00305 [Gammaproteobacteria bacterium]|nr:hypothetical protein [Gammaproteobacteria bacterium]